MSNLLNRLRDRKMPSKDVRICLDLNLLNERDAAMAEVAAAYRTQKDDDRMVGSPRLQNARAAVTDVEARIREASVTIRITGVDRSTYNSYFLQAPPRKGVQEAFDSSKFFMVVARETGQYVDEHGEVHAMSSQEWDEIDKTITDGEHDRIAKTVLAVNRELGGSDIGFLDDASATTRDSFGISASPADSASPPAASGAGNQRKSTSKRSTTKAAEPSA